MDQEETSIFGGLPKRESGSTALKERTDTSADATSRRVGSGLRIRTVAAVALGVPILVIAGIVIINSLSGGSNAQTPAPELSLSPEEVAAAEAAIAEGGGAIPGHIVSGDLCTAIDAYMAAGSDDDAILETTPELLAALNDLAAVDSPNQKIFQDYAAMMNDPAGLTDLDAKQSLVTEFSDAVQVDVTTCL